MFAKKCPDCDQWSYSASDYGKWPCPHCGRDLSDQPSFIPDALGGFRRVGGEDQEEEKK